MSHNAFKELQLHSEDPKREINWGFWTNYENLSNLLRSVLMAEPDVLLQLSNRSALGMIRQGKMVHHWVVDLDYVVSCMMKGQLIETSQDLVISPLAQSPFLLELSHANEIAFHQDMVTVLVTVKYGPESIKKLALPKDPEPITLYFELDYDVDHARKLDAATRVLKSVNLGELGPLNRCHDCRANLTGKTVSRCSACKVAIYCNAACAKSHFKVSHQNTCAKLQELCEPLGKNCFKPTYR